MMLRMLAPVTAVALIGWMAAPVVAQAQTPKTHSSKSSPAKSSKAKSSAKSHAKPAAKPAVPHVGGAEPTLVGQYANWGAYVATPGGKKVCFALAKPSSSKTNPPNRPRDPGYAFVSTRPAEKVTNEVSIMIGYQIKPGSDSTLNIGNAHYAMYAQGDGLWIKNAAEEDRLIDAMHHLFAQ